MLRLAPENLDILSMLGYFEFNPAVIVLQYSNWAWAYEMCQITKTFLQFVSSGNSFNAWLDEYSNRK